MHSSKQSKQSCFFFGGCLPFMAFRCYNYRQNLPGASNDGITCAHRPASKRCWWIQEDCFSTPPRRHKTIATIATLCLYRRSQKQLQTERFLFCVACYKNVPQLFVLKNGFPNLCRWFSMCHLFSDLWSLLCKQIRPWTDKAEWQCSEKNACVASPKPWDALGWKPLPCVNKNVFQCLSTAILQYLRGLKAGSLKERVTIFWRRENPNYFFQSKSNWSSATRQDEDQEVRQKLLGRGPCVSVFGCQNISGVAVMTFDTGNQDIPNDFPVLENHSNLPTGLYPSTVERERWSVVIGVLFFFYGLAVIRTDFPAIVRLLRHAQEGHGEGWSCLGGSWVWEGTYPLPMVLLKIVFMFPRSEYVSSL